ncbi:MAG: hypothetical protein ACI4RA_04430 [Kiritimatiellia bacterium]
MNSSSESPRRSSAAASMVFDRTFHPDEANQAFTVGRLLETGHYTYKPTDHHGPTLYYAAAPLQKAFGHSTTADLDGTLLRCTPLLFALLGLAFLFLAVRRILLASGQSPIRACCVALIPVVLVATAPLFVFFATDFIQEMLLVCFTLMMFWAGAGYCLPGRKFKPGTWALLFGIAAGLCFATKETCVLTFAALALTCAPFVFIAVRRAGVREFLRANRPRGSHIVLAVLGFVLTAVLFFSSFCQDWSGVYNAFVAAPLHYLGRAAGDAAASEGASWHVHPWWRHLQWLFLGAQPIPRYTGTMVTGFALKSMAFANLLTLIHWLLLALPVGIFLLVKRRMDGVLRCFLGLSLYTTLLLAFYSLIPYKTPWCTLQILVPFLVTVAFGYLVCRNAFANWGIRMRRTPQDMAVATTVIFLVLFPLLVLFQEHLPGLLLINREPDSPQIPYNYAHASPEVKQLAACVAAAVSHADPGTRPFIAVALPPADTWPFPWYNRAFEHLTGYWTKFDDLVALEKTGAKPTVVIVPMTEGHLVQPLFPHLKNTKRFYMRPGVRVRVFW